MFLNKPQLILLLTVKWSQILLCITKNSIKQQMFVYTQLNDQTVQFSISHLTHRKDTIRVIKEYFAFPNAAALLEPHHQIL